MALTKISVYYVLQKEMKNSLKLTLIPFNINLRVKNAVLNTSLMIFQQGLDCNHNKDITYNNLVIKIILPVIFNCNKIIKIDSDIATLPI